jgi:hypothetical protein
MIKYSYLLLNLDSNLIHRYRATGQEIEGKTGAKGFKEEESGLELKGDAA